MRILTFIALMYLPASLIAVRPLPALSHATEVVKAAPLTIWLPIVHFLWQLGADSSCNDCRGPQRASRATCPLGVRFGESCTDGIDAGWRGSLGSQKRMAADFWMEMIEACAKNLTEVKVLKKQDQYIELNSLATSVH